MKNTISLLILALILNSCVADAGLSFTEETITTPTNQLVEINVPQAIGNSEVSNKINSKLRSIISHSIAIGDNDLVETPLDVQIDSFNIHYQNFKTKFPDTIGVWEAQVDGEVTYISEEVVSIALTTYTNTGGAHGISTVKFVNFDVVSGEYLNNIDLLNNESAFKDTVKPYFLSEINGKESDYYTPEEFKLPESIGFTDEGIILLYNVYEIAPYSSGLTEFTVPFKAVESYLNYR